MSTNKGGRPKHLVTEGRKQRVLELSAIGLSKTDIATFMGIHRHTLVKHYSEEIEMGRIDGTIFAATKLLQRIDEGNVSAIKFYLRYKAGWCEEPKAKTISPRTQAQQIVDEVRKIKEASLIDSPDI